MSFGILLRRWRTVRRRSQLNLALDADISSRHLSCIETGRAQPSREMVLRLAAALQVPPHERNNLLLAAGYAPLYSHAVPDASELEAIRGELTFFIEQLDPNPVLILDRYWNIVTMNEGAKRILSLFSGYDSVMPLNGPRLVFDPHGLRPFIENWDAVAARTIQRVHHDIAANPSDLILKSLLEELLSYPGVPGRWRKLDLDYAPLPFLKVDYRWKNLMLRMLSIVTTLSIPLHVSQQELRIESFFPADESTRTVVNRLAEECALSQAS